MRLLSRLPLHRRPDPVRGRAIAGVAIVATLLTGACTTLTEPQPAAPGLSGTAWTLVSFHSMDDAQGISSPAAGKTYRFEFHADGRLAMQLDCNRGTASWNEGAAQTAGAELTIGPVASTRAMCPAPDMGPGLSADLPNVASYTMADGHLFLALKMDGGIYELAPD